MTNNFRSFQSVIPVFLGTLLLLASALRAQDKVYPHKGIPVQGSITAMTKDSVTLSGREIPVDKISKVAFQGEPTELVNCRNLATNTRYKDAAAELLKINRALIKQDFILQDIAYYLAHCVAEAQLSGEYDRGIDSAIDIVKKFATDPQHADSFHYYPIHWSLAELYYAKGDFPNAEKAYGIYESAPFGAYKIKAKLAIAQCQLQQEQLAPALKNFEAILAIQGSTPELEDMRSMAKAGKAVCVAAQGNAADGLKLVNEIIAEGDPNLSKRLFARAYNARGACFLKEGKKNEALQAYLHTHLLFYEDRDAHAESLYHIYTLFTERRQTDRAREARELLTTNYAGSLWASKLQTN